MYQRMLVPFDGGLTSLCGLRHAIDLAVLTGGSILLTHVVDESDWAAAWYCGEDSQRRWKDLANARAALLLEQAGRDAIDAGVGLQTSLLDVSQGAVPELILAEAGRWNADLIVIGTHGRRGIDRLIMGSTAEQVMRGARQPVLMVRAAEPVHKTPPALSRKKPYAKELP